MRMMPILTAAMLMGAGPALAQAGNCQLNAADQTYLQQDAQGAAYELSMAQMATQKASNPKVKQYAEMLTQDHDKYNTELQQLGQSCGVSLPTGPDAAQQTQLDRLRSVDGHLFDSTFITDARAVNLNDAQDSQKEESSTQSKQVKAFISKFKSVDEKHTKAAEALNAEGAAPG